MHLEVVSPEAVLFSSDVDSIKVPGVNGEFQMLDNHAPIVSILQEGSIIIDVTSLDNSILENLHDSIENNNKILSIKINSGTIELNENKAIILVD